MGGGLQSLALEGFLGRLPFINRVEYPEAEDDDFGSAEEDPFLSPRRPRQSARASPQALFQPDPPRTEEVLAGAERNLRNLPGNRGRQRTLQQQQQLQNNRMVNYDQQNENDEDGAIQNARDVKLPFNKHDVKLWFSLVESKMQFAGLKNQWSKRQILVQLIPPEFHSDFRQYLQMQETEAGATAYYDLKKAIIKLLGPKKADSFDKAIARVMTGTPSQLGRQILNDICPAVKPLEGCHCEDTVLGIWRRSLPQVVRCAIADMEFNKSTYQAVFDKADDVWASNRASTTVVAALSKASIAANGAEATTDQVAAVQASKNGRRNNKPPRGGAGGGSGSAGGGANQAKPNRGPRHPDLPPPGSCGLHWKFGKAAWKCADRHNCPWRNYESPRPRHNRNISATEVTE